MTLYQQTNCESIQRQILCNDASLKIATDGDTIARLTRDNSALYALLADAKTAIEFA